MIAEDHVLTDAEILLEVFANGEPTMSPELANRLLALRFTEKQRAHMIDLADRNNAGTLKPAERREMFSYANVGAILSVLHAKARIALREGSRGAS